MTCLFSRRVSCRVTDRYRPLPTIADRFPFDPQGARRAPAESSEGEPGLVVCACGRSFLPEKLEAHEWGCPAAAVAAGRAPPVDPLAPKPQTKASTEKPTVDGAVTWLDPEDPNALVACTVCGRSYVQRQSNLQGHVSKLQQPCWPVVARTSASA